MKNTAKRPLSYFQTNIFALRFVTTEGLILSQIQCNKAGPIYYKEEVQYAIP